MELNFLYLDNDFSAKKIIMQYVKNLAHFFIRKIDSKHKNSRLRTRKPQVFDKTDHFFVLKVGNFQVPF